MTRVGPPRLLRAALAAGWLVAAGGGAVLAADPPPRRPAVPAARRSTDGLRLRERPVARDRGPRDPDHRRHRARTGAEIAVYTQYKPGSDKDSTLEDAKALIDQWGVGRAGFDDGLAILST